jgi:hypothetical protein
MADSKSYEGADVSFSYPSGWTLKEEAASAEQQRNFALLRTITLSDPRTGQAVTVSIYRNDGALALDGWISAYQPNGAEHVPAEVGGVTGRKYAVNAMGNTAPAVYAASGSRVYVIATNIDNGAFASLLASVNFPR